MYIVQWWPVYVPWFALLFVWNRLDTKCRWIHIALPLLLIGIEFFTFGGRKVTTEKMWAALYGVATVAFLPMVFMQAKLAFRLLSAFLLLNGLVCLGAALHQVYPHPFSGANDFFQLRGDAWVLSDVQKKRILQVLRQLHGATILPGRSCWNWSQAAAVVAFSENMCYIAYTYNEKVYGRGAEVDDRDRLNNNFYDGKMANPLPFLSSNKIAAVLIWPEDNISDQLLQQFQAQLGPEFFYIDCKMNGANNAGVFIRQAPLTDVEARSTAAARLDIHP